MSERDIFLAALEIADAAKRGEFLTQQCGNDTQLRSKVESLLASHAEAGSFLDHPVARVSNVSAPNPDVASTGVLGHNRDEGSVTFTAAACNDDEVDELLASFLSPSLRPDALGKLGHYDVLAHLGRGAFGIVLKAFDEKLHRIVAIKVLSPQLASTSPARRRFLREARSAAAIRHDNVVAIHAVEEHPIPYLVMEFIPGKTLQQALDDQGPLAIDEVLRLSQQIAAGLAAAHAQGLIHRDIKPGNILLEEGIQWKVKLTDFGLARAADDASVSQSGTIAGTPMYMSPEQAHSRAIDQRSDLFSLGSVMYQMVSGRPPFRAASTLAVLKRVTEDAPRPIREIMPEVPEWLCGIISRLQAKQPDDRIQTAAEVEAVLSRCLREVQRSSTMPSTITLNLAPSGHDQIQTLQKETQPSAAEGTMLWVVLTLAAVCVAGTLAAGATFVAGGYKWFQLSPPEITTAEQFDETFAPEGFAEQAGNSIPNAVLDGHAIEEPGIGSTPAWANAPFPPIDAQRFQNEWAKHLNIPSALKLTTGDELMLIPPGEFQMGTTAEEAALLVQMLTQAGHGAFELFVAGSSSPQHRVRLTQPFYMGKYEVTVGQFSHFVSETGYVTTMANLPEKRFLWTDSGEGEEASNRAVIGVSWVDAQAYCNWLSEKTGAIVSLPTEAQWEYACRAGTTTPWYFGNDFTMGKDHVVAKPESPWPPSNVGTKKPNPFGLHDMHGNVDEWCLDWHQTGFYAISPVDDPVMLNNPLDNNSGRVARGGNSFAASWWSQATTRTWDFPESPILAKGFRIVVAGDFTKLVESQPAPDTLPTSEPSEI
ncbi:MAG: SUMF1/EgtB/PvdO family nonheme iron enzyme [Planctomyces sp.]|nr:SUMF1/EgtB/PvdO family nonheme iron enzyme [Planctomyces sp.]